VTDALNIDLHTHSNRSDGTLAPEELVRRAAAAGVEVLALTDHDTMDGLDAAEGAARVAGIRLVPGVEVSAAWRAQSIHVLGLWVDPASSQFQERLQSQADRRHQRMRSMCARLTKLGLPGDRLHAAVTAQPGLPTRAHLAAAMVAGGHVARADDAFRKYLGKGKTAHLAADWPPLSEIVTWIRDAGGVASLAHPGRYKLSAGARRQMIADFVTAGGGAIEVVTGANGASHVEASGQLAVKFGLLGSVGSDFHDPQHIWNPLGRSLKLPDGVMPVWRERITT
jgi:predicted metal-dependent phosphoesterase TrpH